MIRCIISNIPNTITCLSLVCGSLAIIASFGGDVRIGSLTCLQWTWILIGIAAVCDFLDGAAARALHAYSALGKELDSLSDLVSFGVAPGMMVYNTLSLYADHRWVPFVALLIPVLGEVRLARFNIDDRQTTSFLGLPIPANAIFWIGAVAAVSKYGYPGDIVAVVAIVVIALLMVATRLHMFSLKFKNLKWGGNGRRFFILAAAIFFMVIDGVAGLAWSILLYIALSLAPERQRN